MVFNQVINNIFNHVHDNRLEIFFLQSLAALLVNYLPLLVHDIVVFDKLLANVEVLSFHFLLGSFYGAGDKSMFYGMSLLHAHLIHEVSDAVGGKDSHEIVFQGKIKAR